MTSLPMKQSSKVVSKSINNFFKHLFHLDISRYTNAEIKKRLILINAKKNMQSLI